jgi:hypothetical protein
MSTKPVVATALGVLIPWGNPLIDAVDTDFDPKCAKCGLYTTWNLLGYGPDGTICHACHEEDTRIAKAVVRRLRSLRVVA